MDNFDKELNKIFKKEIKYSNSYEYTINSTLHNIEEISKNIEEENYCDKKVKINIRMMISIAACLLLSFGIIKSKDISELMYAKYEESKKVEIAVASTGINAKFENDFAISNAEIIDLENDNILTQDSIKISVDEITMDDNLLRITFDMELAEEISKKIKYSPNDGYFADIKLEDLLITDENENILYAADTNRAIELLNVGGENRQYILKEELEKKLNENEKYFSGNEDYFINKCENGKVELIYNLNLVGLEEYYPRSKNLKFDINKIRIITEEYQEGEKVLNYSGNWNLKVDIPENVYSRKRVSYKEINNNIGEENKTLKFDILQTCSEVKLSLKTIDRASLNPAPCLTLINSLEIGEPSTQIRDWFVDLFRASEEYKKYEDDLLKSYLISGERGFENYKGETTSGPYLENENGQKFGLSKGPYSNGGGKFTDDNFYQPSLCFDLKQEYLTNKLTLHFIYLDKEYIFEYEKESEM